MNRLSASIVITNWNGKDLLKEILPTVIDAVNSDKKHEYEIIVVDDCSTDESIDFLIKNFPGVRVEKTPENMGFQKACNYGVEKSRHDIVMLLNNDIKMDHTSLEPLIEHFTDESVFAVSGKVFDWSKEKFLYGNRGGYFKYGHFWLYEKEEEDPSQTLFACGGAFMCDKKKYQELGGFNNIFHPLYYEEIDISYRALKRGWKVLYEPKSNVYHRVQSTITKQHKKRMIGYISGRNNYLFVWKNITDKKMILMSMLFTPLFLIRDIFRLKFRFWVSFYMALKRFPLALKERKNEKNTITHSDKEILSNINQYLTVSG
jgi:O-antigen biosynthesis protein